MKFREEVLGNIMGLDHIKADKGTLNNLYPITNNLAAIVVEDEAGIQCRVPEMDVDKLFAGMKIYVNRSY
ncbi:MAG: hypothetical protein ACK4ND_04095 [Cytophagaceae bacterium]